MTQDDTSEPGTMRDGTAANETAGDLAAGEYATKSERTRQRILDSAAKMFRQQGYGARLSDIAAEAGMQAGSLYYHFDGRESLVADVLRLGIETAWGIVNDALDAMPADASPLERLETAIRAHAAAVLEISDYTAANSRVFAMAAEPVRKDHYVVQQQYGEFFHELFAAASASGALRQDLDLPVVRMLMFGAMNWTAEWYRPNRGRPASDVIDQLVAMTFSGLVDESARATPTNI